MIEADIQPMTPWTVDALAQAFEFDRAVLGALDAVAIRAIPPEHAPPLCRICACSEYDPCFDQHDETCVWVEADLCSRCALVEGADVLDGDALTSSAAA